MPAPTNLYQYYQSIGQRLPSVSQRAPQFEQFGLGPASQYRGTAQQNTQLLQRLLQGQPTPAAPTAAPTPQPAAQAAPQPILPQVSPEQAAQTQFEEASRQGQAERQALLERQRAEEEALFRRFEETLGGQEQLSDIYRRLTEEAGLPGLQQQLQAGREQVFSVKDLLDRLQEDVASRTEGTLTSEAQRRRQIAAEGDPLRTQLGRLLTGQELTAQQIGDVLGGVSQQLQFKTTEQQRELQPIQARLETFSERATREMTGFNKNREEQLNVLIDRLQQQRTLSQREWEQVSELAKEERLFEQQRELQRIQDAAALQRTRITAASAGTAGERQAAAQTVALRGIQSTFETAAQSQAVRRIPSSPRELATGQPLMKDVSAKAYVPIDVYLREFQNFSINNPQQQSAFLEAFNPYRVLNPNDPLTQEFIATFGGSEETSDSSGYGQTEAHFKKRK